MRETIIGYVLIYFFYVNVIILYKKVNYDLILIYKRILIINLLSVIF